MIGTVAVHKKTSKVVSHCCVIFDPKQSMPTVGLFGAVITTKKHQRKGLSKMCVRMTLQRWDQLKTKSVLILGTGSPHAAKVYAKSGFRHLNGGLNSGRKGYNPDDMGEWIMIRGEFEASTYYNTTVTPELTMKALCRHHWASLVLLLNAENDTNTSKLNSLGILDGTEAEEAIVALINRKDSFVRVCEDRNSGHVYGICVNRNDSYAVTKQAQSALQQYLRDTSNVRMVVVVVSSFLLLMSSTLIR